MFFLAFFSTFHLSGTGNKTVTTGIPRLKEVINVSKNIKTPGMTVHLLPPYNMSKQDAERIKVQLQHASLNDVITRYQIRYDPNYLDSNIDEDRSWMDVQTAIPDEDAPVPDALHPWVFRISFSRKELYIRDLTMTSIADKVLETFDVEFFIMHSDDNNEQLTMHIRVYTDLADLKSVDTSPVEEVDPTPTDSAPERERAPPPAPNPSVDGNAFLDLIKTELLTSITVCGVPGIEKTFISKKQFPQVDPETGVLASTGKEFVIETDGINMRDCIFVEGVDPYRLTCNDPRDILSMFGVELAREVLLEEIRAVTEGGGTIINYRHLSLLCDVMTHRGQLMAITRHGIRRTDAGPLMKCTFEQTVDILNDAAMRGRSDDIQGVAEHIMLGAVAPLGTGMMDIVEHEELSKLAIVETSPVNLPPPVPPSLQPTYCPLRPSYLANRA